jgi:hypothetical protein
MSLLVTVIGDVVDSRSFPDRQLLHDALTQALGEVAHEVPGRHRLGVTAGDEFQGTYTRLGEALAAVFALRVRLSPSVVVRFGLGRGEVTVLDADDNTQDGPGWWAAREAIEHVKETEQLTGWSALRTAYRAAEREKGADERDTVEDAVNSALVCQDLLVDSWDTRTWSIVRGIMQGRTQGEIAAELGISRQAVQQRRRSAGLPMVLSAAQGLSELP